MIKKKFDPLYNTIARTLIYQTKFPKVKSYMPNVYTVDKKGSLELDDGFSCTKSNGIYHLGIHITNPMATLKEENLLFQNACQRVSSVYLKNLMIPMFPHELATGLFSLNEGNVRHALNAFIDIDLAKKEISKFEIILAPVYVRKNDTYTNCNTVINKKIGEQEYIETLKNIQEIMPLLKETYKIDKLYASINRTEQNATATNIVGKTKSEQMIETLMVFMNYMYSKYAMTHSIPILYRNHERYPFYKEELATYEKMLKSSKNDEIYKNEIKILTSNYPRSFYAINNIGHFGLGLPSYTHITSPDRRIADCINILMFQKYQNEETLKKGKQLLSLAQYINERNHSISNFVMEYSLKKK